MQLNNNENAKREKKGVMQQWKTKEWEITHENAEINHKKWRNESNETSNNKTHETWKSTKYNNKTYQT